LATTCGAPLTIDAVVQVTRCLVEACVDSVDSALAAARGGAGRLELCASLCDAGTTPSAGMIAAVKARVAIPVFVIVRPRGGGFVYSDRELDVMRRDIDVARQFGADGIVLGALGENGRVDVKRTLELVTAADDLPVTFHRAFDCTPDLGQALEALIVCGVRRVLTSGGATTALEGIESLATLVLRAAGRIQVMAGGGIREKAVRDVVTRSGVGEIHVRGTKVVGVDRTACRHIRLRSPLPADESSWEETDEERIRAIVALAGE